MKPKYRIVRDAYAGFEAQYKVWWWPFWIQCNGINTRATVEDAEALAKRHAFGRDKAVVKILDFNKPRTE